MTNDPQKTDQPTAANDSLVPRVLGTLVFLVMLGVGGVVHKSLPENYPVYWMLALVFPWSMMIIGALLAGIAGALASAFKLKSEATVEFTMKLLTAAAILGPPIGYFTAMAGKRFPMTVLDAVWVTTERGEHSIFNLFAMFAHFIGFVFIVPLSPALLIALVIFVFRKSAKTTQ